MSEAHHGSAAARLAREAGAGCAAGQGAAGVGERGVAGGTGGEALVSLGAGAGEGEAAAKWRRGGGDAAAMVAAGG